LISKNISPAAYKYWLYTSHYSTLSNFTIESVQAAQIGLQKIISFIGQIKEEGSIDTTYKEKFTSYINEDLNTSKAIALIFDLLKDDSISAKDKKSTILDFDKVLKLQLNKKEETPEIPTQVIELAQRRKAARDNKDFALADALREEIEKVGYTIKDTTSEVGFSVEKK
jgi:cysteinyl-tRNA synthetase